VTNSEFYSLSSRVAKSSSTTITNMVDANASSVVEEPFASVNRVDWNRPQPGTPSASPTADPVPSRMAAEKGALPRAFASSSDDFATRLKNYIKLNRIRHSLGAVCLRHYTFRTRVCVVVGRAPLRGVGLPTPCMGAYSEFRGRHIPRKPAQKVSRLDLGPAEANRVLLACCSDLHV
jgi:hypothetical protein